MFKFFKRVKDGIQGNPNDQPPYPASSISPYDIQPLRQLYYWDCGITCIKMILPPDTRQVLEENFDSICQEEGFGQSTWTIDLCFLLKRFGINHAMYTENMGISESHRKQEYYKGIIDKDTERVRARFLTKEVVCEERILDLSEIIHHVVTTGPAILLTDASLLFCVHCGHNRLYAALRSLFGSTYKGHYILVTGVSRGKVEFIDPARGSRCVIPRRGLHTAMSAAGTDRDVILLTL